MYKSFTWDRYLKFDELTSFLEEVQKDHPDLCNLYSIGKTFEGRDIWCIEITNKKTGDALSKPAVYVDGNTHAGEVTGCMIALYTVAHLVQNYGKDDKITAILDETTFYVVPRLSADGAELYLNEPYIPRSSIRPWPYAEEQDGLYAYDVDGDGVIAQMRVEDENGQWRASEKDERVMVRRKPNEVGGKYYTLLGEGMIRNFNGVEVKPAAPPWGLDINRNYGYEWRQNHEQPGAGPYPFSEPESRSVAEFFESHGNIVAAQSYHTFTGAILRPPASKPDLEFNPKDMKALKELGAIGTDITGYPVVAIYEEFGLSPDILKKRRLWGSALEWMYEHGGVIAYSTEVWDMPNRAIGKLDTYKNLMDWTEDEQLLMQKWNDENLDGDGFINWRHFDHPQLGDVEIGGWKHKFVIQNPPAKFLEQECKKNTLFCIELAHTVPKLRVVDATSKEVADGVYEVRATIRNMGYLPTNATDQALANKKAGDLKVKIDVPQGAKVLGGDAEVTLKHIEGRLTVGRAFATAGQNKFLCRWVVKGPKGTKVKVEAKAPKAGCHVKEIELK